MKKLVLLLCIFASCAKESSNEYPLNDWEVEIQLIMMPEEPLPYHINAEIASVPRIQNMSQKIPALTQLYLDYIYYNHHSSHHHLVELDDLNVKDIDDIMGNSFISTVFYQDEILMKYHELDLIDGEEVDAYQDTHLIGRVIELNLFDTNREHVDIAKDGIVFSESLAIAIAKLVLPSFDFNPAPYHSWHVMTTYIDNEAYYLVRGQLPYGELGMTQTLLIRKRDGGMMRGGYFNYPIITDEEIIE